MRLTITYLRNSKLDTVVGFDSDALTLKQLYALLDSDITEESREQVKMAIFFTYAEAHLTIIHQKLGQMQSGSEGEYHWLRSITGGGSNSLSGKRTSSGAISTNMKPAEYKTTHDLTTQFYVLAKRLLKEVPRAFPIPFYRGFGMATASQESILKSIGSHQDLLPSSISWSQKVSLTFAKPGEGQVGILLEVLVPQDYPLIMTSYPDNSVPKEKPHPIDIGQAEVLIAPVSYKNAKLLQIKEGIYYIRVEVTPIDEKTVLAAIQEAAQIAQEQTKKAMDTDDKISIIYGEDGTWDTFDTIWSRDKGKTFQKLVEKDAPTIKKDWLCKIAEKTYKVTEDPDSGFKEIYLEQV